VTSSDVPAELRGAWRRRSIRVGDGDPEERYDVIWIQGSSGFVDLRLPRDATGGLAVRIFAGTADWDGARLTWTHEIDIDPARRAVPDVGAVELAGDVLVERGGTGDDSYVEEYLRLTGSKDEVVVRTARLPDRALHGVWAQAGGHRLVIVDDRPLGGELVAEHAMLDDAGWRRRLAFGTLAPDWQALF